MFLDPLWFLMLAPAMILAFYAQWKVKSTYVRYAKVASSSGLTAAQVAERILSRGAVSLGQSELRSVRIAAVPGTLTDHYDPRSKTLRLSKPNSRSLADIGVAAHEAGHALQDAARYQPLVLRSTIVPAAQFGSQLAFPLLLGGLFIPKMFSTFVLMAIIAYSAAVLFTLVTLPVEFNASRRAMKLLKETGIVTSGKELAAVGKVLNAAALTYVAAAATAVLQLVYLIFIFLQRR
jgi:hypothetical protein